MTELDVHRPRDIAYPDALGVMTVVNARTGSIFKTICEFGPWIERVGGHRLPAEIRFHGLTNDTIKLAEPEPAKGYQPPPWSGLYDEEYLFGFLRGGRRPSYYDDYLRNYASYTKAKAPDPDPEETARHMNTSYGFVTPKTAPEAFVDFTITINTEGGEAGDQHA
jgi:hypothetical protein